MTRSTRLNEAAIGTWLETRAGWSHDETSLRKAFSFPDYSSAVAFVVRVALEAEKRDHHPDMLLGFGRVDVRWTTHNAGGVTDLDCRSAEFCDQLMASP